MSFSKADRAAYGMGLRHAQAGALRTMNPYTTGGSLSHSWLAGYAKGLDTPRQRTAYQDATDTAYEDQCAAACGVGL